MRHQHPGPRSPYEVHLTSAERAQCEEILRGGRCWVWHARRAQILLQLNQGKSPRFAAEAVGVGQNTARRVAKRYVARGIEHALNDDERPGGRPLLNQRESQEIVAMIYGPPPQGRSYWSIRLIAQEAVTRGIVPRIGKDTVRILLGSHELKPWREKNVGDPGDDRRVHD